MDPMREMYEFLAFGEALKNGLSPDALIEEHVNKGKAHLESSLSQIISQLEELNIADEQKRDELLKEARELAPTEARAYSSLLTQRVKDLKETVRKQETEFNSAEKISRELSTQNTEVAASVNRLKGMIRQQQDKHSRLLGEVYAAGNGLCQYVANPNYKRN
jgi:hypothetical protein